MKGENSGCEELLRAFFLCVFALCVAGAKMRSDENPEKKAKEKEKNVFKPLILMRCLTTEHQHSNLKQTGHKNINLFSRLRQIT